MGFGDSQGHFVNTCSLGKLSLIMQTTTTKWVFRDSNIQDIVLWSSDDLRHVASLADLVNSHQPSGIMTAFDLLRPNMRWISLVAICASLLACNPSSNSNAQVLRLNGHTMGTLWTVKMVVEDITATQFYWDALQDELDNVNNKMSTYQAESEVSRFNAMKEVGCMAMSKETLEVVAAAQGISQHSGGAFDITVAPLVRAWGFGADYSEPAVPNADKLKALAKSVGFQLIRIKNKQLCKDHADTTINLSAIAKGYAVDQIARYFDRIEVEHYLVEVGGELFARGTKPDGSPWRIGIETPREDKREVFENTIIPLRDVGIATSGDYRNYFEKDGVRYSHSIDPRSAKPITHNLASVTVVAENSMLADAWATAFMVIGAQDGLKLANKLDLAALFIVRHADKQGFEAQASSAFNAYMAQKD